jgi:hypothetical protein
VLGPETPFLGTFRYIGVRPTLEEKYPDRYEKLLKTLEATYQNPEYKKDLEKLGTIDFVSWIGPEASAKINQNLHEIAVKYENALATSAGGN